MAYDFTVQDGTICLVYDGNVICENIEPFVFLENGEAIKLEYRESNNNEFLFTDDKSRINLALRFIFRNNLAAVFIDASCAGAKFPYDNLNYFSADCAAGIHIKGLGEAEGYMADYMFSEYWANVYWSKELSTVPANTQALLCKNNEGYSYLLTVCDKVYKSVLGGNTDGGMLLSAKSMVSCISTCNCLSLIIATGEDVFSLPEDAAAFGLELLNNGAAPRTERRYPEIFNYLGWCSWDAFQLQVSHQGLLDKADELMEKEIPVRWFIIDDMWAEVKDNTDINTFHNNTLYSFEADKIRFPKGLHSLISELKEKAGLKIGMWHPATGYWRGIDPGGDIARNYRELLCTTGDGRLIPDPALDKSFAFYNAFHEFLKRCGADFLKIDNQSFIHGYLKHMLPIGTAARQIHRALEASACLNFDNNLINCMGMASENMWNRPQSAISRCSDDFVPEDRQWFIKHILQCSYNSFVQGSFIWSDWDMWWSDDEQAVKNGVLRAMSGGPIYLSDKLGRSIKSKIMPLVLSDGTILRCDRPAMPSADCLVKSPQNNRKAFKVWNTSNGCGIIAAFNLDKNENKVTGTVSSADIPHLEGEEFLLFEFFSRKAEIIKKGEELPFELKDYNDFRLWIFAPVFEGFAPIGLADKYISCAAVETIMTGKVLLAEGGLFAFYNKKAPDMVLVNGRQTEFTYMNGLYYVNCEHACTGKKVLIEIV